MEMNDDTKSQRRIITSAVVLAILVAAGLWYIFVAAPAALRKTAVSPSPSSLAVASSSPETTPTLPLSTPTPTPVASQPKASVKPTPRPKAVSPTTKTGANEWLMIVSVFSAAFGAYKLARK